MSDDIEKLNNLITELVSDVTASYPEQIISMVLFGSATSGEWIKGKSDIDCIVLIKDYDKRKQIDNYLLENLLTLDKKYELDLSKTCTIFNKSTNPIINQIIKAESRWMFGRPFLVMSEDQIDIKAGLMKRDIILIIGTRVIASLYLFFHRMRSTGKIIYGKDIIKEFPKNFPTIEKIKLPLNAGLLLFVSCITFLLDSKFAFQHAIKANFWACDNTLFILERPLLGIKQTVDKISEIFKDEKLDINHLKKSFIYKNDPNSVRLTRGFVLKYILKTTKFTTSLYIKSIKKNRN